MTTFQVLSPVDGRTVAERSYATVSEIDAALARARAAQVDWGRRPLVARQDVCARFVDAFVSHCDEIAEELSWQMGRPLRFAPGEVAGLEERARYMVSIAETSLADVRPEPREGFRRFIRREPLGVVVTIAPWNYPYLTAVNSIVPAILAGNAVLLRHSTQTPLCAERFTQAFREAGLPSGVFQHLHTTHGDAERLIAAADFVAFTGSVAGGRSVQHSSAERFIGLGLELGGKDPAYVRPDADLAHAASNLVDGAFFNSGQSCCGIERIYLHASL